MFSLFLDNFWYESAIHLLEKGHKLKKKKFRAPRRQRVVNVENIYGSEENFISTKIDPNVPQNVIKPNCTGISHIKFASQQHREQSAFIGFYGSGNHMMR